MNKGILQNALTGKVDLQLDYRESNVDAAELEPPLAPFAACAENEHPMIQQLVSMFLEN
ncbi:MAG TPA: hypothetical protein VH437_07900 [Terriglobales bacterium]